MVVRCWRGARTVAQHSILERSKTQSYLLAFYFQSDRAMRNLPSAKIPFANRLRAAVNIFYLQRVKMTRMNEMGRWRFAREMFIEWRWSILRTQAALALHNVQNFRSFALFILVFFCIAFIDISFCIRLLGPCVCGGVLEWKLENSFLCLLRVERPNKRAIPWSRDARAHSPRIGNNGARTRWHRICRRHQNTNTPIKNGYRKPADGEAFRCALSISFSRYFSHFVNSVLCVRLVWERAKCPQSMPALIKLHVMQHLAPQK